MSKPPLNPEKTLAGIAVDPQTLERVIPESRRPDGTFRKQIKIRPGFTPQEDVRRFRGSKQSQMDANTLPKGHIIGWVPPSQSTAPSSSTAKPVSKSAKKNAKRREKRKEDKVVPENWDEDDDEKDGHANMSPVQIESNSSVTSSASNDASPDELTSKMETLKV